MIPAPLEIYSRLFERYGRQHWWPADSPFEVMVGAVLTQNAAWSNVEKAIANLRRAGVLEPARILDLGERELAELLRPSGYFNVKAQRLRNLCAWLLSGGGVAALNDVRTETLRGSLLAVSGVGPETADDILLYALGRPVFVVDAYTRRLLLRMGLISGQPGYEALRGLLESSLPVDVQLFNEFHALIVRHAKVHCRLRPLCEDCCLVGVCAYGAEATAP